MTTRDGSELDFTKYPIGSFLRLLPWHSCAVAHQHASLFVVGDDEDVGVEEWGFQHAIQALICMTPA